MSKIQFTLKFIKKYLKNNNINLKENKIKISKTFKINDNICHANNFIHGFHDFYFIANEDDVKNYSNKNGYYFIKQN